MEPTNHHDGENQFLDQLENKLNKHLFDPELSVKKILRLVFMSRTDLHRKLRKEAGMSTTEYIRYTRLKVARKILEEKPQLPVGQVAEEVGFNNQSYFAKRFKELFGIRPGECRATGSRLG